MNYADNEADDDTMRLSPSTQLSTNDSDIFTENFESDSWLGFPRRDQLPPPPSDHELLALQTTSASRRVGDPLVYSSTTNNESLLSTAVDVSIPTPAAARKKRFHPNQYLVDYQYSDVSEVDSVSSDVRIPHDWHGSHLPFPESLPNESDRLELSALSSVEEEEAVERGEGYIEYVSPPPIRRTAIPPEDGKPPKHPCKRTTKRNRKSYSKRGHRSRDYDRRNVLRPLIVRTVNDSCNDDVTSPTQSSDVTVSGRDDSVIDR